MRGFNGCSVSFEVFPPNSWGGIKKLKAICEQLTVYDPDFVSVTFGAVGATQMKTLRMVRQLAQRQIPTTPHLSCVGMTKARLQSLLAIYQYYGVKRLVVLRGDVTQPIESDFNYACELVAGIRKLTGDYFHIIVAAYPEFHPEASSSEMDLIHFKRKVDAGADSAITQFFYNSDAYFRFCESCQRLGIQIPIIPGIMPIQDFDKLERFSATCGAEIPLWLRKKVVSFAGDLTSIRQLGVDVVSKLCERLILEGVSQLHFYTLNQVTPTARVLGNLFADKNRVEFLDYLYA